MLFNDVIAAAISWMRRMWNILKMLVSRLPNCVTHKSTDGWHISHAAIRGVTSCEQSTLRTFVLIVLWSSGLWHCVVKDVIIISENHTASIVTVSFFNGSTAIEVLGLLIFKVVRSHPDTPHSLRLLWMSDQPITETSTWQHTAATRDTSMPPTRFEPTVPASK